MKLIGSQIAGLKKPAVEVSLAYFIVIIEFLGIMTVNIMKMLVLFVLGNQVKVSMEVLLSCNVKHIIKLVVNFSETY